MSSEQQVYCQKCREPATATTLLCRKCGGRVVKHCPACGFVLSVAKKFCDACGEPQSFDLATGSRKITPPKPKEPPKSEPPRPEPPKPKDPPKPEPAPPPKEPPRESSPRQDSPHTPREELPPLKPKEPPLGAHTPQGRREAEQYPPLPEPPKPAKEPEKPISIELPPEEPSRLDSFRTGPLKPVPRPEPAEKDRSPVKWPEKGPDEGLSLKPPSPPPDKAARDAELERFLPRTMISHIERGAPPPKPKETREAPAPREEERPKERRDEPRRDRGPVADAPARPPKEGHPAGSGSSHGAAEKVEPPKEPPAKTPKEPPAKAPEGRHESAREKFERELAERERLKAAAKAGKDRPRERAHEVPRHPTRSRFGDTMAQTMRSMRQPKAMFSTSLALFLIASGGLVYLFRQHSRRAPRRTLIEATGRYLFALKDKNFGAAYSLLSAKSRLTCKLDDFQKLQQSPDWAFDDVEIASLDNDRALVRYKLHVSEKPTEEDTLEFVREEGGWRRAYWWHLLDPIENDLAAGDFAKARARAVSGLEIVPDEPLLLSYLCEADYGAGDLAGAERECLQTLEAVKRRASRLDDKDLFYLHSILADIYRNTRGKLAEAANYYRILLAFPRLEDPDRCRLLLALADTNYLSGDYANSRAGYEEAGRSCTQPEDTAYLQRNARVLGGAAGADAVAQAKSHRMPDPTDPARQIPLVDWRRQTRKELAQRLHLPFKPDSDDETWTPEHAGGALYQVTVKNKGALVLTAKVDLWTGATEVKIER